MVWKHNSYGSTVARHTDGSIDFDAYRAIARRERQAAIISSMQGAARAGNAVLVSLRAHFAGRTAKHPLHLAK